MTTNWQFDKNFLQAAIAKGENKLKDPSLSRNKKKSLRYDIATFKRFLENNFENGDICLVKPPKDVEKLKDYILKKMERQYKTLGPNLIKWVMKLSEEEIFNMYSFSSSTNLSLEEQAEFTIKNYERNSKKLLNPAKQIILDDSIKQIQLVEELNTSSYCHHDEITNLSYIIIDPTEAPWILNHEVQHAIEGMIDYPTHTLYTELGSQFYEMLFTEELYMERGSITIGDFQDRVDDTDYFLKTLNSYFRIMMLFASVNFDVPTKVFIDTFLENKEVESETIEEYLREEIATDEQVDNMCYMFSFLKAIELREKFKTSQTDSLDILEPYLNARRFNFQPPQDNFGPYKRYVEEMHQKVYSKK